MTPAVRRDAPGLLIRRPHPGPVLVAAPGGQVVLPEVRTTGQARAQRAGAAGHAQDTGLHSAGWIRHDGGREASLHSA